MRKKISDTGVRSLVPVLLLFIFNGCQKNLREPGTVISFPTITSVSPATASHGEIITIYGRDLLKDTSGFSVTINNKVATVILYTNDSIKVIVPENAGSGAVAITSGNKIFAGPDLSYEYEVIVSTVAGTGAIGTGDGQGANASFNCPWGIVADDNGDLYIADTYNRLIRKIDRTNGTVSTIPIPTLIGSSAFYSPYNIAIDKRSKSLYVTDFNEHLMKINSSGDMSVIFTDSMPLAGIALGPDDKLYVGNNTTGNIFQMDTTGQNKSTYVSGIITPRNIIFDKNDIMYVGAYGIYKITGPGAFSVIADANDFKGWEIAVDSSGNFYEADHFNNRIQMIDKGGHVTVIAGNGDAADVDGIGLSASFDGPQGITIDKEGNLYITTFNYSTSTGNKVRKVTFR